MKHEVAKSAPWRPVAYVAVEDHECRARIADRLQRLGWSVVEQPSGFHVLSAIADVIEGEGASRRPGLIVVDEISRGCSGKTLARGLRELGLSIPIVLIRDPWLPRTRTSYGKWVYVLERGLAAGTIAELVRPWSPISVIHPASAHERAMA